MSAKKVHLKRALQYVEDYLEYFMYVLSREATIRIETRVEEEKEESLKLRIISSTSDGKKVERVEEVPKITVRNLPKLNTIMARPPPKMIRPTLLREREILVSLKIPTLTELMFPHIPRLSVFGTIAETLTPITLPFTSSYLYSWFKIKNVQVGFPRQYDIKAFTFRNLLRLLEVLPKLVSIPKITASVNLPLQIIIKFPIQQNIKVFIKEVIETLRTLAQAQRLRGASMLDLILEEEREKLKRLIGTSNEYIGEPVIIILPKVRDGEVWYIFWLVCRELYREIKGQYPESAIFVSYPSQPYSQVEHSSKETDKDKTYVGLNIWLKLYGKISNNIVVLEDSQLKDKEVIRWLGRRLREAFSQGLGFLIILTDNIETTETTIRDLCKPYKPRIISLYLTTPISSSTFARASMLVNLVFGIPQDELKFRSIDEIISLADRAYREFIEDILLSNYITYVKRDVSEHESEDHIAMKALAIKYLHEKENVKLEDIKCTYEVGEGVIADVYVESKNIAIECETLLGTAPSPLLKILESARKYLERKLNKQVREIWIIVRNWSAMLHLGDLYWIENMLKKEFKPENINIKFFVPNIYTKSLTPLSEIAKKLFIAIKSEVRNSAPNL